jgi:hypothetical protein
VIAACTAATSRASTTGTPPGIGTSGRLAIATTRTRCCPRRPAEERFGTVDNVVFPTAIEAVGGQHFVFYGMADTRIGVALRDHA